MIKRILPLGWLILAWLLAMFGADFWDFNVMELFASVAIIGGVIWTYIRWRKEKNRKLKLIVFPDKWAAYRRKNQDTLEIQIFVEVFIPHHSVACKAFVEIEGKIIPMQFSKPQQGFATGAGRWIIVGTTALSPISQQARTIEARMEIELDGEIKKSSGKRTIIIIDS